MDNRRPRSLDNRETTERKKSWTPPSILPEPTKQDGYSFRWIRASLMGASDPTNMSARLREGWEFVKAEDHPELMLGQTSGNVEVGGLILCKMPNEMVEERNEYYQKINRDQMNSVEQSYMRENDRRMPKFSERS
jgi:hypothetical protein